jgi:hypothetical protein
MKEQFYIFTRAWFLLAIFSSLVAASPAAWDYDGDGKTDLLIRRVFEPGFNGNYNRVYMLRSQTGFFFTDWGSSYEQNCGSSLSPGDFDGDGKTDITAAFGCADDPKAYYYILNSSNNTFRAVQWGLRTDLHLPQDYDGDGKTDFAVWRFDTWYILNSSDGSFRIEQFGNRNSGDLPIYGDYDGDGKADLAVRRTQGNIMSPMPITFIIKLSASGSWQVFTMGDWRGDIIVPGDYDGDGKTDMALWSGDSYEFGDGRWKWIRSSDGQFQSVRYGLPGDRPVQSDYDGDGKTDLAVYRAGSSSPTTQFHFYIQQSRDGFKAVPWGSAAYFDDTPMTFMNTR